MQNEPLEVTLKGTAVLKELCRISSVARRLPPSMAWCERPRTDIIAEMQQEHLQPFVSALQGEFHMDDERIAEAIRQHSGFNIIHRET